MFRRRHQSSDDNLFNLDQKHVKTKINKNLAHIVKLLQKEFPLSSSPVQPESILAQHLCNILESAFIHGLKSSFYEKENSRTTSKTTFPKPQFWNVITKISHAETLARVQELTYITTRIGKCRSWLRLTLNDGAVTSYLSSILSKEQRSTIQHYYEQHSLFLDQEHAEIFLRILQGIESVGFNLSFNSSMLNQWTKTPLELAGLIPPTTTAQVFLGIESSPENNNFPKIESSSRKFHHRASAPALVDLRMVSSLPTSSDRLKAIAKNKDETLSSIKETNSVTEGTFIEENSEITEEDVLHKRQLIKKKRKRKRLSVNDKGVRVLSSWSSLSSGELSTSGSNNSTSNTPRSRSFCETPPTTVLKKNQNQFSEKMISPTKDTTKSQGGSSKQKSLTSSDKENKVDDPVKNLPQKLIHKNKNLNLSPINRKNVSSEDTSDDVVKPFLSFPPDVTEEHNPDSVSTLEESTSSQSSCQVESKLNSQIPLPNVYKMSYLTSSSSGAEDDGIKGQNHQIQEVEGHLIVPETDPMQRSSEAIDIYSSQVQQIPSNEEFQQMHSIEDLQLTLSTTGRIGNSLSVGGGWSSDKSAANTPDVTQHNGRIASPGYDPGQYYSYDNNSWRGRMDKKNVSETKENGEEEELFIRREGYLRRLGDSLKLWKQRWFVLHGSLIDYYKDKNSDTIQGRIDLKEVSLLKEETDVYNVEFCVCIMMKDGTKHHLAAEDKESTLDWAADFKRVMYGPESSLTSSSKSEEEQRAKMNYLDEYEVISDRNPLLNNSSNTSWQASMNAHMGRIANEKGLDAQNYQCADCASPIGIIYGPPRLCSFTGRYYCSQCHINDETHIPARIIHNWDFRKHKVAKRSKLFLEQAHKEPLINLSESNPGIYKYIDEMGKILQLRRQLKNLEPYLQSCRNFDQKTIAKKLNSRKHFFEDCHLYSVYDLLCVQDKSLGPMVSKIVTIGMKHVYGCLLCKAKGFLCEICRIDDIIFPFETEKTVQCFECKSVFHRGCKTENTDCPKCERRQQRCLKNMEEKQYYTSESEDEKEN